MNKHHHHWENVYQTKGSQSVSWFQESPEPSLSYCHQAALPTNSQIIDIGGGASRLVDHLLEQKPNWQVTLLDISGEALRQGQERLGDRAQRVIWQQADITQWHPEQHYHLWHDRALFHFMTDPADRLAYKKALRHALPPSGYLILGTFALNGPERCSGLPVVRYDITSLRLEIGPDFQLLNSCTIDHKTPSGALQSFLFCFFQKKKAGFLTESD